MIELIIGLGLLVITLGAVKWMTSAEPAVLLRVARMVAGGLLAVFAILLIFRGKIYIAGPALLAAFALMKGWLGALKGRAGGGGILKNQMTAAEAYEILGLQPGASAEDIKAAHRRLVAKIHPDHDGSDYLTAKINQARDCLLKE